MKVQVFCYVFYVFWRIKSGTSNYCMPSSSGLSSETLNLARRTIYGVCSQDGKLMQDSGFVSNDILSYYSWTLRMKYLRIGSYRCHGNHNLHLKMLSSPVTGLDRSRGFQEVKVPRFHDNGTVWWQGCRPYAPAAFTPQEIFLVLRMVLRFSALRTGHIYPPRKCFWYSFVLEAESTLGL